MPVGLHYLSLFGQTRAGPLSFLCHTNQSHGLVPSRQVSPTHFTSRPEVGLGKALCSTAGVLRKDSSLQAGNRDKFHSYYVVYPDTNADSSINCINQPATKSTLPYTSTMHPSLSLKAITTAFPLLPNDQSISFYDMAASMPPQSATHPLSEVNIDALETQKFDLPSGMVQRSNSTRSTRSDKSVSSTSSSIDNSVLNSPIESPKTITIPPRYVVLSLWPHATESQISSYVEGYEDLYPSTKVLLLRSSWRGGSPDLDSILNTITASLEEKFEKPTSTSTPSHPVLLHLFGHTGALNACTLLRAYRARTTTVLDVRAIVSDIEPSLDFSDLYTTLLSSPSNFFSLLFALLLSFLTAAVSLFTYDDATHRIRADLTNPGLLPASVRKCFVFPAQEMMFSWCEAPGKNGVAERREWSVKRTSVDARGRWSGEKERYWLGVEGVWEGGC
jgi:hypothetical protein